MSVLEKKINLLMNLGLTCLEAKIYNSLVETGAAKVEKISKSSHVSRPDVYRTARKLQEIGLLESKITRPLIFKAIPPKIAIRSLLNHKKKNFEDLKSQTSLLLSTLEENTKKEPIQEECQYVLVPSKEAFISRVNQSISYSKKSIEIVTSCKRLQYSCYSFSESLKKAWTRNVKCRVLIERPNSDQKIMFEKCYPKPWAEIRTIALIPSAVIGIFDNQEVFILTTSTAGLRDSSALWSNNRSVVSLAKHYLDTMWFEAQSLETITNVIA